MIIEALHPVWVKIFDFPKFLIHRAVFKSESLIFLKLILTLNIK